MPLILTFERQRQVDCLGVQVISCLQSSKSGSTLSQQTSKQGNRQNFYAETVALEMLPLQGVSMKLSEILCTGLIHLYLKKKHKNLFPLPHEIHPGMNQKVSSPSNTEPACVLILGSAGCRTRRRKLLLSIGNSLATSVLLYYNWSNELKCIPISLPLNRCQPQPQ